MATTHNSHTGNNSTKDYSFTFPYLKQTDIKVTLDNVATTAYTFANATTVRFDSAPAADVAIKIYRATDDSKLVATFYPGSAIRSNDLNDNYTQNLYSTQENTNNANEALDNSRVLESGDYVSAITKATNAVTTANTADTNASNAVSTANTASASATSAVNTANTASGNATNAVNTANDADANATAALDNSRESDGSGGYNSAIDIANTAKTTADTALDNSRDTDGTSAISIAKSAEATVAESAAYIVVANHAALPALSSLSEDKFYQVSDSTGIEDETDVSGEPSGFTGDDELAVKLKSNITADPKRWDWQEYYATDPETRYRKKLIVENLRTISEDYTVGADNNGFSIGPVTISSGKTITIPANSKYVVMN